MGIAGVSRDCQDAVIRLLQHGDNITHARILSCENRHCLLLTLGEIDVVAVKSGFGSGYHGEGARTFSYILGLLRVHSAQLEEYAIEEAIFERLDLSALTVDDLDQIDAMQPCRPRRFYDYIFEEDWDRKVAGNLWVHFPAVIPFRIIDPRIMDLALSFFERPDDRLLAGYRRLEDLVRERTSIKEFGVKLFSRAFIGPSSALTWKCEVSEQTGRGTLFTAAYLAYRNPRAHRELDGGAGEHLAEFLLLNQLYRLEKEAVERKLETPIAPGPN
jgi:hypothetical protein